MWIFSIIDKILKLMLSRTSPNKKTAYGIPAPQFSYSRKDIQAGYQIVRNIKIMDKIPDDVLYKIVEYSMNHRFSRGEGTSSAIASYYPNMKKSELKYIASTIHQAANSLYDIKRDRKIVSNFYIWHASGCRQHKHLNNLINSWDTPISTDIAKDDQVYSCIHPAQSYRCLCYAEPIVSYKAQISPLSSPLKIYRKNKIERMSKTDFKKKYKIED